MITKKVILSVFLTTFIIITSITLASASVTDWFDQVRAGITGKATSQSVGLNITIGNTAPQITTISSISAQDPTESSVTIIMFNFTAYDADGINNLNTTGGANFTRSGETTKYNSTCTQINTFASNYANYSCMMKLWYFDGAGAWTIGANITDINGAQGHNTTATFTYNELSAFVSSPSSLSWASLSPGATNQTSNNDPLLLNNTGNKAISDGGVQINATNLVGESDNSKAIYAGNFTVSIITGSSAECRLTTNMTSTMSPAAFTAISNATLPRGNHSVNDGVTGQRQLYLCIRNIGSELSSQAYSTSSQGSWTTKIV